MIKQNIDPENIPEQMDLVENRRETYIKMIEKMSKIFTEKNENEWS